jgi:hypothetical protein
LALTKTVETDLRVGDYFIDDSLKQFYTKDMNIFLETYEPGKPEHKPKLMEQMKLMEEERNRRMEDHNKMLEAQQKLMASYQKQGANISANIGIDAIKQQYEKQLADKTYLINELLKKVKALTNELDECKKSNITRNQI